MNLFPILGLFTKLIPFIVTVIVYFLDFIPQDNNKVTAIVVKCLPNLCLIIFVGLHSNNYDKRMTWYSVMVMLGLFFGGVGDALLVYNKLFEYGMCAFAIGHIFYITAFGFDPRAWILGLALYLICIGLVIFTMIQGSIEGIVAVALPVYALVIITMTWRAWSRLYGSKDMWTVSKWITAFGALCFVASDGVIAINKFVTDIEHHHYIVMSTYYAAQFGMAMSILDPRVPEKKKLCGCVRLYC